MLTDAEAALLEALVDPRVAIDRAQAPPGLLARLDGLGLTGDPAAAGRALDAARRERSLTWGSRTVTQGEVLDGFALHCRDDLDDVEVLESTPTVLVARWRDELSRLELRAGTVGVERLAGETPTLLLAPFDDGDLLARAFVDDAALRSRLAVCDLDRLERVGAPRSSVFVYLEWHLREAYSVKLLPAEAFTRGLIDKGVISLGMG